MNYKKLLQQAIDLHVHIGPEIIPRKFSLQELLEYEKGKLKGIGVKNHFFPTVAMGSTWTDTKQQTKKHPLVINSVVLNNYVGGFNPDIIYASAALSKTPIIVWFPTLHTKNFLESQKFEIPEEWIDPKQRENIKLQPAKNIKPLSVLDDNGNISKEVEKVLTAIKDVGGILATGHLPWKESKELVKVATKKFKIKKIIITHPIYQKINMPLEVQKELAQRGAFIEHCFSMYSIDKIPIKKIAEQIKYVGAENCILSSDVGQSFSKNPSEALLEFITLLSQNNITKKEIITMLVDNPNKIIK